MYKGLSVMFCLTAAAFAADSDMQELGLLLSEAGRLVQQERLNIDYTPSVISSLEHRQMKALGLKTLFEAVGILPGVQTSINQVGIKKVIVRGFDNPNNFTSDKTKFLIDGVPIETALFSNTSMYLDLPVDIIERIELLRGPASALYGNGAFNGAINVVTRHKKDDGSALFFGGGSYGYMTGGARTFVALGSATALQMDAYVQRSDKQLEVGKSFAPGNLVDPGTGQPFEFSRPYETNEQLNDYSVGIHFTHGGWSLQARIKEHESGNFYGWNERLELTTQRRSKERYFFVEAAYEQEVGAQTTWKTTAAFSRFSLEADMQDYVSVNSMWIPYTFSLEEEENNVRFESGVTSRRFESHTLEGGVMLQTLREISNAIDDDLSPYGRRPLVEPGLRRDIAAVYVRDTWEMGEDVTLFAAIRGDYFSKEKHLYPSAQLAMVYSPRDTLQLKLNYGHAFRVPSWVEQYSVEYGPGDGTRPGNPNLTAETTDTFEAIGIFRFARQQRLKVDAYYSLQHSVIDIDDNTGGYRNWDDRTSAGAEAEYDLTLRVQDRFHMNLSYTHATYVTPESGIKQLMPTAAIWMAKGYYIYYATPAVSLSLLGRYIGTRPRNQEFDKSKADNRDLVPYYTCDTTVAYHSSHHWDLRVSVKNIFDAPVHYPSYYSHHSDGIPREGRNFLAEAEYRF